MQDLDARLRAARVESQDPIAAWRELRRHEGPTATVIDLYELVARARGRTALDLPLPERQALAREVMPEVWPGWQLRFDSWRQRTAWESDHLVFRDHLRADPQARAEYVAVKREAVHGGPTTASPTPMPRRR